MCLFGGVKNLGRGKRGRGKVRWWISGLEERRSAKGLILKIQVMLQQSLWR